MSLERVIKALVSLGLERLDAEVYVYIANKGPQTVVDLASDVNCDKHKIYHSIAHLQANRLVSMKDGLISALPFEEALELLIEQKKEQTEVICKNKKDLIVNWKTE